MSDSLPPHRLQHTRLPCPSPAPRVCSNSCSSSHWCHPTISSSVIPFSSCPQSFPALGSFPMNQLFTSGGQSIGASAIIGKELKIKKKSFSSNIRSLLFKMEHQWYFGCIKDQILIYIPALCQYQEHSRFSMNTCQMITFLSEPKFHHKELKFYIYRRIIPSGMTKLPHGMNYWDILGCPSTSLGSQIKGWILNSFLWLAYNSV